jgi:DNA-binding NarL/FixJ family response regulator
MQYSRPICIKVAHEQAITRAGVVAILEGRHDMVAASMSDLADAHCIMSGHSAEPCDVMVADHATALSLLGAHSGKYRGDAQRGPKVLVLTHLDRGWDVRVAMEAGVHGYLLQGCTPDQLIDAVGALCAGVKYVSGTLAPKLADSLMSDELTARELEVLRAMSTGASNKAISRALGITEGTVKTHVRAILSKVGASARTGAVAIAARKGLTSAQPELSASAHRRPRHLAQMLGIGAPSAIAL